MGFHPKQQEKGEYIPQMISKSARDWGTEANAFGLKWEMERWSWRPGPASPRGWRLRNAEPRLASSTVSRWRRGVHRQTSSAAHAETTVKFALGASTYAPALWGGWVGRHCLQRASMSTNPPLVNPPLLGHQQPSEFSLWQGSNPPSCFHPHWGGPQAFVQWRLCWHFEGCFSNVNPQNGFVSTDWKILRF